MERADRAIRPIRHLVVVPDNPDSTDSAESQCDLGDDTEMRRAGGAWVAWRLRTGQINNTTAKEQRYAIGYFADFMGERSPKMIGESDMERYLVSMTGLAPGTIRHRWRTAYAFLEWCVDEGKCRKNVARRIPTPKVPRAVHRNLRPDQSTALHDACVDDRERLIVALGFQLGMRRSEIARAQVGDLDLVGRTVTIVGKGGHQREVALTAEAERAIGAYMGDRRWHAGALVRDLEGQHGLTPGYIGELFERIAYRAGVKTRPWDGVATHSARHTCGTDVAHACGDPTIVRDVLGHASLNTTSIYVGAVSTDAQREAMEGRRYAS
jgi:site-specific recombinase XerD